MSKHIAIKEGDRARNFGPTQKLKTKLQGDTEAYCYWVPEEEVQTGAVHASENRTYTPDEIDKYGIDSVTVNVVFTGTTADGQGWSVYLDSETGMPVLEYDEEELKLTIVNDDVVLKELDSGDILATIDDAMLEDIGLDSTEEISVSLDEMGELNVSGTDLNGVDALVSLDLETLEPETYDCPASIEIVLPPNKTSFNNGREIDTTGMYVYAYDENGNVWRGPDKYRSGHIPNQELIISPTLADKSLVVPGSYDGNGIHAQSISTSKLIRFKDRDGNVSVEGYICPITEEYGVFTSTPKTFAVTTYDGFNYAACVSGGASEFNLARKTDSPESYIDGWQYGGGASAIAGDNVFRYVSWEDFFTFTESSVSPVNTNVDDLEKSDEHQVVNVQWTSPCGLTAMGTEYNITVTEGSHHSGKF